MSQKRFVFDDELEEDLQSKTAKKSVKNTEKTPLTNSIDKDTVKKSMGKRKKRRKIKKRWIALILLLLIIIIFIVYVFIAGGNDGPVYGDRCASLIAIDEDKFTDVENGQYYTEAIKWC